MGSLEPWGNKRLNQSGLSIIEVLLSIALLSLVSVFLSSNMLSGLLGQRSLDKMQNVLSFAYEIRLQLQQDNICTGNVKPIVGALPLIVGQEINLTEIKAADKDGNLLLATSLIKVGDKKTNVELLQIKILTDTKLSNSFFIGNVKMKFRSTVKSYGPTELDRSFPIAIQTDSKTGAFVSCGALDGDHLSNEKICHISSEGRSYYNPTTKMCESRFKEECVRQIGLTVSCPTGTTVSSCGYADISDTAPNIGTRTFLSGRTIPYGPPAVYTSMNKATNSCSCDYPTDVDTSTWKCEACCEKQVVFD